MYFFRTTLTLTAAALAMSSVPGKTHSGEIVDTPRYAEVGETSASERYLDLPSQLIPETVKPSFIGEKGAELVFAFVIDTTGKVELSSIETLLAPDSSAARAARKSLSDVRYIPARLVLDVGQCVRVNGILAHCGGLSPVVRKLRSRTVLRIESYRAPS